MIQALISHDCNTLTTQQKCVCVCPCQNRVRGKLAVQIKHVKIWICGKPTCCYRNMRVKWERRCKKKHIIFPQLKLYFIATTWDVWLNQHMSFFSLPPHDKCKKTRHDRVSPSLSFHPIPLFPRINTYYIPTAISRHQPSPTTTLSPLFLARTCFSS